MRIYHNQNVYDAALERMRWLFAEFENVVVAVSGGKDSTVIYHLALQVARELNRLPLTVMWIDQEAEWQATVDICREIMYCPDVRPRWYQMPMVISNATSGVDAWLRCWHPDDKDRWVHPQDDLSVKENVYGTDRFHHLFDRIIEVEYAGKPACIIGGVRCEESPARAVGLTTAPTYKWATWGKIISKKNSHFIFYPIYDWSYTDVWVAIHKNGWPYNRVYDAMYNYGVPVKDMRVSNVHHETAVGHLFHLQEIEPETYQRLTQRIGGIDTAGKMGTDDFFVSELPTMFSSWKEYRDYLLEKLITVPEYRESMAKKFARMDEMYEADLGEKLYRVQVQSVLTNDHEGVKLGNFENTLPARLVIKKKKGKVIW